MTGSTTGERAARNESIFRGANEHMEDRLDELSSEGGRSPFICECEDPACTQLIRLTREEYEAVRAHPRRFVIARGHSVQEAEIIVEADGHEVVEKYGEAGEIAERLDPRS
jgi:hypothetical protein